MNHLRVLMLSNDYKAFLYGKGDFKRRLMEYRKTLDITCIIFAPKLRKLPHPSIKMQNLEILFFSILNPFNFLKFSKSLHKLMKKKGKFHVITAQDPLYLGAFGIFFKYIYRIPLNIQLHADIIDNAYWINEFWINKFFNILARLEIKRADSIRVVNKNIANLIKTHLKIPSKKIFTAPVYTNLERYFSASYQYRSSTSEKTIVLSVGRLVPQKNFINLLNAIRKIRNKINNVVFLIIGEGPEYETLMNQIIKNDLKDIIQIIPALSDAELIQLYHKCAFFVLSSNYEGWGLVCIEAMACGKPVIMTNTGCAGELVLNGRNGFVIPVNNSKELADRMLLLLRDAKKRIEMGKESKKILDERYNKEMYLREYYKSLFVNYYIKK